MFIKLFQAGSAAVLALLATFLFIFVTSVPEVTYSASTVEYNKNGYPEITIGDIVEVKTPTGKKLPRSEWSQVLASGRFDPVPHSEER
jgi:hypothetical protein